MLLFFLVLAFRFKHFVYCIFAYYFWHFGPLVFALQRVREPLLVEVFCAHLLPLLGGGRMDLWAVVYHAGATLSSGHYSAVVRGADKRFRFFDDRTDRSSGHCEIDEDQVHPPCWFIVSTGIL